MAPFYKKAAAPVITVIYLITALFSGIPVSHASEVGNERVYYFLNDHLGNVDVVLDENGKVVERADYMPYGSDRLRETEDTAPDTDYKFTGKEQDEETGLYYFGARYYDAAMGRFISSDPLLERESQMPKNERLDFLSNPQNLNAYTYALNNPVKYIDEQGEIAILPIILSVGAFIGAFFGATQNVAAPDLNSPPIHTKSEAEILVNMVAGEVIGGIMGGTAGLLVGGIAKMGFKTLKELRLFRRLASEGIDPEKAARYVKKMKNGTTASEYTDNVREVADKIEKYVGEDAKIRTSNAGETIVQSKDELREVRFDFDSPAPHNDSHVHVIEYKPTLEGKKRLYNERAFITKPQK